MRGRYEGDFKHEKIETKYIKELTLSLSYRDDEKPLAWHEILKEVFRWPSLFWRTVPSNSNTVLWLLVSRSCVPPSLPPPSSHLLFPNVQPTPLDLPPLLLILLCTPPPTHPTPHHLLLASPSQLSSSNSNSHKSLFHSFPLFSSASTRALFSWSTHSSCQPHVRCSSFDLCIFIWSSSRFPVCLHICIRLSQFSALISSSFADEGNTKILIACYFIFQFLFAEQLQFLFLFFFFLTLGHCISYIHFNKYETRWYYFYITVWICLWNSIYI